MSANSQFPQYRKYKNNRHFFKITGIGEFEEISFIGTKKIVTLHTAKILPDRNLIHDLLYEPEVADVITEEEYHHQLNN